MYAWVQTPLSNKEGFRYHYILGLMSLNSFIIINKYNKGFFLEKF